MPTITCPNCDGKFRSQKDLSGKQVRCPRCDSAFVVDDDAEEIVLPRGAAAAPPRAAPPKSRPTPTKPSSRKPARGKKRKASSGGGGFPKPLLICLGIALLAGAGWYGLEAFNKGNLPIPGFAGGGLAGCAAPGVDTAAAGGGLAGMLGLNDTPESLMADYTGIGRELQQVLAGVTDEASVEPALNSLEGIVWDLVELRRRAALAPQVSKQDLYKVLRRYSSDDELKAADVVRVVEEPPDQAARFDKIRVVLEEMSLLARGAQGAIRQGLEQPPEPRNEFEQIELERAGLLRQAMQQVLQVDDASAAAAAVGVVQQTAAKLQALAERKVDMDGVHSRGPQAASHYLQWTVRDSEMMRTHVEILENKSIAVEPLNSALRELWTANSNIDFANLPGALSGAVGGRYTGDPRPAGADRAMPGAPGPGMGRFGPGGGAVRGGPPPMKTGPAGPDEVIILLKGDIFDQQPKGPEQGDLARQTAFEVLQTVHKVLRKDAGIKGSHGNLMRGNTTIRVRFDGDPKTLAETFSFGTVNSVDAVARRIAVTVSPALVEQVRQSMQQGR